MVKSIYVPPVIGMSDLVVAAVDASTYARSRAQLRCDGDDDQDQINEALEAGGHTRLTGGAFIVSDSVVMPSLARMSGAGQSTIIRATADFAENATAESSIIKVSALPMKALIRTDPDAATENVHLSDMDIDGNSANQTSQTENITGVMFQNTTHGTISRVTAHDVCRTGGNTDLSTRQFCICTTEADHIDIIGCNCYRAGYEALAIREDSHYIRVFGGHCIVDDNAHHAAQVSGEGGAASHVVLYGTRFTRVNHASQVSGFINHGQDSVHLIGCTFEDCALAFTLGAKNVAAIGCTWEKVTSQQRPIILGGVTNCLITGCKIYGNGHLILISGTGNANIRIVNNLEMTTTSGRGVDVDGATVSGLLIEGNIITPTTTSIRLVGTVAGCKIRDNKIAGGTYGIWLDGGTISGLVVDGNDLSLPATAGNKIYGTIPADSIIRDNTGRVTRNKGTATVDSGATYEDVSHGLMATPTRVDLTPTNSLGDAVKYWVSDIGATTFRINVNADPGATTAKFNWDAGVYGA